MADGTVKIDIDVTDGELDELEDKLGKVDSEAKQATIGLKGMIGSVSVANLVSGAIGKIVDSVKQLGSEALASSDQLDKLGSTLEFAGKTESEIDRVKTAVKSYADQTVYDMGEVANVTAQLGASGVSDYEKLTQAMGNLNAVAGGNRDTFSSVGMVMTQTAGAGKLTTENWNQLAGAIPGASGILQEALLTNGAYTGDFREAMAKGQITAEEFNQAIMSVGFQEVAQEASTSVSTYEGAFANMQSVVVDKLMGILEVIGKDNITNAMQSIADGIATAFDLVIEAFENIKQFYLENEELCNRVGVALIALGAGYVAFKATVMAVGLLSKISEAGGLISVVSGSVKGLFTLLMANPIALVIAGLVAFGVALVALYNNNETFRTGVQSCWNAIKAFVAPILQTIASEIQAIWGALINWWEANSETIKQVMDVVWEGVKTIIQVALDIIVPFIETSWNNICTVTQVVWDLIKNAVDTAIQVIQGIIEAIMCVIEGDWEGAWNAIKGVAEAIWNGLVDAVGTILKGMIDVVKNICSGINDAFMNLWNIDLSGAGQAIIDGFMAGMRSKWEATKGWVTGIASWIKENKGPISYDKKLLIPAGKAIMYGFNKSLQDNFGGVRDTVSNIADVVVSDFNLGMNKMNSSIKLPSLNYSSVVGRNVNLPQNDNVTIIENVIELDGKAVGRGTAKYVSSENDKRMKISMRQRGVVNAF